MKKNLSGSLIFGFYCFFVLAITACSESDHNNGDRQLMKLSPKKMATKSSDHHCNPVVLSDSLNHDPLCSPSEPMNRKGELSHKKKGNINKIDTVKKRDDNSIQINSGESNLGNTESYLFEVQSYFQSQKLIALKILLNFSYVSENYGPLCLSFFDYSDEEKGKIFSAFELNDYLLGPQKETDMSLLKRLIAIR